MKTSRLPVSTWVALDAAACITACCTTRSKATVGSGSTDAEPGTGTKARSSTSVTLWRSDGQIGAAGRQLLAGGRLLGDRQQQVFQPHGVVAAPAGVPERALNRLERLGGERDGRLAHEPASSGPASGSIVTSSGNSCASAVSIVVRSFVSATSWVIDAGDAESRQVHAHHDGKRLAVRLLEDGLEHPHHELLRGVVVVVQQHPPQPRALHPLVGPRLGERGLARVGPGAHACHGSHCTNLVHDGGADAPPYATWTSLGREVGVEPPRAPATGGAWT